MQKWLQSTLWRLTLRLKRKPYWLQLVVLLLSSFVVILSVLPFIYLTDFVFGENNSGPEVRTWFWVILVVPFLETLLFQHLPFRLMQCWKRTKANGGWFIFVSAFLFGISHRYSLQYILFAFSVGIVLGYTYFFYSKRPVLAFWSTTLIHGMKNLVSVFLLFAGSS